MKLSDPLEGAEGYLELGMFLAAWDATEELPPEERASEPVSEIRLRILTALAQWSLGEEIARLLLQGCDKSRRTVARFRHARGRVLWQSGGFTGARDQFRQTVEAWKGVRKEFGDDDLDVLFRE